MNAQYNQHTVPEEQSEFRVTRQSSPPSIIRKSNLQYYNNQKDLKGRLILVWNAVSG